jgi:hypothetical protein
VQAIDQKVNHTGSQAAAAARHAASRRRKDQGVPGRSGGCGDAPRASYSRSAMRVGRHGVLVARLAGLALLAASVLAALS